MTSGWRDWRRVKMSTTVIYSGIYVLNMDRRLEQNPFNIVKSVVWSLLARTRSLEAHNRQEV